jgi:hypothetical protein
MASIQKEKRIRARVEGMYALALMIGSVNHEHGS